ATSRSQGFRYPLGSVFTRIHFIQAAALQPRPGFPGPKPALISWMEQESEAWSPAAQDPEKGERLGGARRGDVPNRKEEEPEEVPRAKGPRKAPVKESPEVLVERNPDPAISVAPARAQPPKNAAWDPTTGAQPPAPIPSVDA
ncbi:ZNF688 isoform 5, partial [Pongo abelii]